MSATRKDVGGLSYTLATDPISAIGVTPWYPFGTGTVTVSIGGSGTTGPTAITATVQRSGTDPNDPTYGATPAQVSATALTGNTATGGVTATAYTEAAFGWWRVNVTAYTAGTTPAVVTLTGRDIT